MKPTPYYELHITVEPIIKADQKVMEATLAMFKSWSFSRIDNDIIVGPGSKLYATAHVDGKRRMALRYSRDLLDDMVKELQAHNLCVIRKKIECVVLDQEVSNA